MATSPKPHSFVILSEAKDLLSRAPRKSRSFASLRMTIYFGTVHYLDDETLSVRLDVVK